MKTYSRREFLISCTGALALLGLSSCAGKGVYGITSGIQSLPSNGGACAQNGTTFETTGVTQGHTHTIQLTAAEIIAANASVVFTTSINGHSHTVQLTSQQYASLLANNGITINTGPAGDGHVHSVTINCA